MPSTLVNTTISNPPHAMIASASNFDPHDREGRIRHALKLSSGPLPKVAFRWLCNYHQHLLRHLAMPFGAQSADDGNRLGHVATRITVVGLVDPCSHPEDESLGLLCKAIRGDQLIELSFVEVETSDSDPNFQLVEDYWYWYWNWRFDPRI